MAEPEHGLARHPTTDEKDEEELAEFGYKQELRRDWGLMHNFGISFSIIVSLWQFSTVLGLTKESVITGITTLFSYGLATGGPGGKALK